MKLLATARIAVLVLGIAAATVAPAGIWTVDSDHTNVQFSVRHMGMFTVNGRFTDFDGKADFDPSKVKAMSVEFTINTASINTDNAKRDEHLRSADFLNVEKFPVMTFKSKKVTGVRNKAFTLIGDLTIRGITKEVVLEGVGPTSLIDPYGNSRAGAQATAIIDRRDFDIKWSEKLDNGGLIVSESVEILIDIQFIER